MTACSMHKLTMIRHIFECLDNFFCDRDRATDRDRDRDP
jgi:hypothetical protein